MCQTHICIVNSIRGDFKGLVAATIQITPEHVEAFFALVKRFLGLEDRAGNPPRHGG
jgi:hypothetical protein